MERLILTLAVVLAVMCSPRAAPLSTATLAVPGRTNATVSLATDGAVIGAAWSASLPSGETDIYFAASSDGGVTFTPPVRVNGVPGDARVNGEQPPRLTLAKRRGASPVVTVVWTSKNQQGTTILHSRSEDGGRTFSRATLIPDGAAAGNRGWHGVAVDTQGATRVAWLDHREMAPPAGGGGGAHVHGAGAATAAPADSVSMAQKSKLYLATVGETASPRIVTSGVCYCCKTAVVTGADNAVYLAWRHVFPGSYRDIAFSVSRDGGRTFAPPQKVHDDRWKLDGCPDDGPAMTIDTANRLHIAWPTLVPDGPGGRPSIGIFYAQSQGGAAFAAPERLATEGLPHHPQIAVNDGKVFVVWDELKDGQRRIVVGTRSAQVGSRFARTVVTEGAGLLYPSLVPSGSGVVIAWTSAGERSTIQLARVQ